MTEKLFDDKYETSVLDEGSSAANFRPMPIVLLANKRDVPLLKIPRNKYSSYVAENGLLAWYETSAKDPTSMCHSVKQVPMAEAIAENRYEMTVSCLGGIYMAVLDVTAGGVHSGNRSCLCRGPSMP